jgi:xylose isomerase
MTTEIMLVLLGMGGFTTGGLNFDAKRRRESHEPIDLMHAHIGGMDAFARGLKVAHAIREDGRLAQFVQDRYSSYDNDIGAKIEAGTTSFAELEQYALSNGEPTAFEWPSGNAGKSGKRFYISSQSTCEMTHLSAVMILCL